MKFFSVLKRRLFTIAPISQLSEFAASIAVLAEVFNSITSREPSKSLSAFFALSTGSLSIMFISI